ncbi:nitrate- and nitrite sensing domain-containing protein [Kosakonia cowanii]|uniref:methyl-accepting chemotaxis protein n=1 Tax=Kosakonia cowanii TaxID=208223 RepID=UPI0023F94FED|nr:methyl-accepting chemotaxis protein [Kosakonia cowanii]MDF7759697.1 nitrate- and nitrite sensing domain-containing protein [Kosakonia cowanii]
MKWIYRISMKSKLLLALLPLLFALIWLAASGIMSRVATGQQMHTIISLTTLAKDAGSVIHELQKERGLSAGYIGSKGQQFNNELSAQYPVSTKALTQLTELLNQFPEQEANSDIRQALAQFRQHQQGINDFRNRVRALSVNGSDSLVWYSTIINDLLNVVGGISQLTDNGEIVNQLAAYYSVLNAKEQSGIERALLSNVFSADRFTEAQFRQLNEVVGKQASWLAATHAFSSAEVNAKMSAQLNSPQALKALSLRQTAIDHAATGGFGVAPADWFNAQTARINTLRAVEEAASHHLLVTAQKLADEAWHEVTLFAVISVISLAIALFFAVLVASSIHRQLQHSLATIRGMDGDLTQRLDVPGSDELSLLNRAYNQAIENIQHIVSEIKHGAGVLRSASSEIASGNQDLASRTDQQAASLVETAASMEQIATAVNMTADNANEAKRLTQEMEKQVQEASRVAGETSHSMSAIRHSSEQISNIVSSIDEISFQTNLLALNAAVEAARAGELGKGFAVVASEVRNLSQRCANEAQQIRELVSKNMEQIQQGVALAQASDRALHAARENTGQMLSFVSDIAHAANEQSLGVSQVHEALNQLEQVTQQNAGLVASAASASQLLDQQSETMSELVGRFVVA